MFKKDKQVRFLQEFSSPVLGNVWIGRIASVPKDLAKKMISSGLAEEFTPEGKQIEEDSDENTEETGENNPESGANSTESTTNLVINSNNGGASGRNGRNTRRG